MRFFRHKSKHVLLLIKINLCLITSLPVVQDRRDRLQCDRAHVEIDDFKQNENINSSEEEGFVHFGNRKIALAQITEQTLIKILLKDYDWRVRPHGLNQTWSDTGGPVIISVNMLMRSISKIDDVNMEYSAQFTFREEWTDPRLAYAKLLKNMSISAQPKFVILVPDDKAQQIWIPDSFFQNEKTASRHFVDKPNIMIRIYPNGEILYSVRLSMTLSCQMNLINYPLDNQTCYIEMASYAYTTDDIIYRWSKDPIQLKDTVNNSLPSFELEEVTVKYCTSKTTTGEYSCLRAELNLKRLFSYYLVHLYIPSFLLVVVSWVSFWLDKSSAPARVTLGITTLLTMTTQASGINAKLPPVSYTKAIDIWIGVCLAFIFAALLEFALVNYAFNELCQKEKMKPFKTKKCKTNLILNWKDNTPSKTPDTMISRSPMFPMQDSVIWKRRGTEVPVANYIYVDAVHSIERKKKPLSLHYFIKWLSMKKAEYKDRAKLIDLISRIMFPTLFFSFNIFYWIIYL